MVNSKYKNDLFVEIFSQAENGLAIYNALLGTHYEDASELEIVTLKDAIFMHKKNDVALLLHARMLMLEHQSTINPNMPLRGLQYYGKTMDGYVKRNKYNIYGEKLIKIPAPFYFVLYNGTKEAPDRMELKLSDAFQTKTTGFEWTATMLNINAGHNQELLAICPILNDYATLIRYVRENAASGMEEEPAVEDAVNRCIEEGHLEEYLRGHLGEAKDMLLSGFDEEIWKEGLREEGREQGREQERIMYVTKLLSKNKTAEEIAELLDLEIGKVKEIEENLCVASK